MFLNNFIQYDSNFNNVNEFEETLEKIASDLVLLYRLIIELTRVDEKKKEHCCQKTIKNTPIYLKETRDNCCKINNKEVLRRSRFWTKWLY